MVGALLRLAEAVAERCCWADCVWSPPPATGAAHRGIARVRVGAAEAARRRRRAPVAATPKAAR